MYLILYLDKIVKLGVLLARMGRIIFYHIALLKTKILQSVSTLM